MMKFEANKVSELYYINYVCTLYFRYIRNPLMGKSIYLSINLSVKLFINKSVYKQ